VPGRCRVEGHPSTVGRGFHSACSAEVTPPVEHSSINWDAAGQTRANLAVVALGTATSATERAINRGGAADEWVAAASVNDGWRGGAGSSNR